jgi:hypothetical protein
MSASSGYTVYSFPTVTCGDILSRLASLAWNSIYKYIDDDNKHGRYLASFSQIVINQENTVSQSEWTLTLWHESAHAEGIDSEFYAELAAGQCTAS